MKKIKKTEKLLLQEIFLQGKLLQDRQRGLEVGQLISMIRKQLKMSQRSLAKRSGVQQASISKIEKCMLQPNIQTLMKLVEAFSCDLLITVTPRYDLEEIRKQQAQLKAQKKIQYLQGTMSLEKQLPSQNLMRELFDDEVKKLLDSTGPLLWDDN